MIKVTMLEVPEVFLKIFLIRIDYNPLRTPRRFWEYPIPTLGHLFHTDSHLNPSNICHLNNLFNPNNSFTPAIHLFQYITSPQLPIPHKHHIALE